MENSLIGLHPRFRQRFIRHISKSCQEMPNKTVAKLKRLHHSTVNLETAVGRKKNVYDIGVHGEI